MKNASILIILCCLAGLAVADDQIVITEIMYNSIGDEDIEWIEIYNPTTIAVDLTDWYVLDNNDGHEHIALSGILGAGEALVIVQDQTMFSTQYPTITNVNANTFGGFWGLNNATDTVRIFNSLTELVDLVQYSEADPWPVACDGDGPSLFLTHVSLDNNDPASWIAGVEWGSPGVVEEDVPTKQSGWSTIKTLFR